MHKILTIFLVLPVMVYACDPETQYPAEDGTCCKMCGPGKKMGGTTDCNNPICLDCDDLEYQDSYTKETKCKRQPICDENVNFQKQNTKASKMKFSPCLCIPNYHCSGQICDTCVKNTECKAGEKVLEMGDRFSDTVCTPCPNGTFSNKLSAKICQPWTECRFGLTESHPGSSTSDRTCVRIHTSIIIGIVALLVAVLVILFIYLWKKGKMGSAVLKPGLEKHRFWATNKYIPHQPAEDRNDVETGEPLVLQPVNQPQEDNEDVPRQEEPFKHGISANGLPVRQDVSKSFSVCETETSSQSFSIQM